MRPFGRAEGSGSLKVLLTGAAGFIGSHVARLLAARGCDVHALVRPGGDASRINDVAPSLRLLSCDLADDAAVASHVRDVRPEACVHLAWGVGRGGNLDGAENVHSLNASLRLALALAEAGCGRLVAAGTCFEYDTSDAGAGLLSETSPTRPRTLYGASKLALWQVLERLSAAGAFEVSWLRFFYLYGPGEDARRLVPSVILSLLEGREAEATAGEQVRDYLHVEDAADAVRAVLERGLTGVTNVGSGRPVAVREVVERIGELTGRPELIRLGALPYREGDPPYVCADAGRLAGGTGWSPRFGLEDGLRHTIRWWQGGRDAAPAAQTL